MRRDKKKKREKIVRRKLATRKMYLNLKRKMLLQEQQKQDLLNKEAMELTKLVDVNNQSVTVTNNFMDRDKMIKPEEIKNNKFNKDVWRVG